MQINDLSESDLERAMGIENVEQSMLRGPMTGIRGETLICFPLIFNGFFEKGRDPERRSVGSGFGSGLPELDAAVTRT
ncbi:hypothetical protein [Zoogloea sp.]|uniref:hypothetical protein n=1 Tax=Zoogloea sp. TaxID=49181 RepID=UPI0026193681|nr:hypothetical protein [Zoogloea sp.]MDD3355173.1 hypothetical protein [Zoogloea sp.]